MFSVAASKTPEMTVLTASETHPVDPASFRRALSCFPTGVAIVTTLGPGERPIGLTISSFNSVSMEPPLILWSLARKALSLSAFRAHPAFAVNVLAADQEELCRVFASPVEDRFAKVDWTPGIEGVPVLAGTAASFECRKWRTYDGGDHEIFIGEVIRHSDSERTPLVFGKGRMEPFPVGIG
jgi:flavin reductase (DIM6/NTAB) family NADH-FMN oxidoreductase RutF